MIGALVLSVYQYREGKAQQERVRIQIARAMIFAVDSQLSNAMAVAQAMSNADSLAQGDFRKFHARASDSIRRYQFGANVVLRDLDQQLIFNTSAEFGAPLPRQPVREHVAKVIATGQPMVSNLFLGLPRKRHLISVDVPVEVDGRVRYVLGVGIEPSQFTAILKQQNVPPDWTVSIFDRAGQVVGRNHASEKFVGKRVSPSLYAAIGRASEDTIESTTLEGIQVFTTYSLSPLTGWGVAIGVPFTDVERALLLPLAALSAGVAALFAIGLALAWLVGGRIARSVTNLIPSALALGTGEPIGAAEMGTREATDVSRNLARAAELLRQRATAVQEKERQLLEADRRKDEFLAMLAHELRNPLAPISAAADLLGAVHLPDAQRQRISTIIGRQTRHMTGLVDDLLDVSRVNSGIITLDMEDVDIAQVVSDAVEQARPLIEARKHHFTAQSDGLPHLVHGDFKRLVQVVVNLLHNAAKFTPEGGTLTLATRDDGGHVLVEIADDGVGMSADLLAHAFDLFSQGTRTLDRSQGGLGLGLALVRSLVELHGGRVTASSPGPGMGSTFGVRLPRLVQAASPAQA